MLPTITGGGHGSYFPPSVLTASNPGYRGGCVQSSCRYRRCAREPNDEPRAGRSLRSALVPTFGPCRFPETAGTPTPHAVEDRLLIGALEQLAPDVQRTGVKILLEPLAKKETHYMNLQSHGARIIEQSGGQCARLLSDFYHMQMEEQDIDDPEAALERALKYVRRQWQEA